MEPANLLDFEALARERMPQAAFDYVAGGADDEVTLRENRAAFERITFRPRVLRDVSRVEPGTTVLGEPTSFPVLLAPTAFQRLVHPEGEIAAARAAARAGVIFVASTLSSASLEEIAAAGGPRWFQLYCGRDQEITRNLVERAAAHGYGAICLTVDVPRVGRRERDVRNRTALPPEALPANFRTLLPPTAEQRGSAIERLVNEYLVRSLTWDDVKWVREITDRPLLLKGILTAEDARLAVEHGVQGIVVSNHGGRQLDGAPATVTVLPEIVQAVQGRAEVLLDGGVRRGTDVVKALALGARAVLIGRPYLWGLAVDGEAGVARVLALLRAEVELALALLGCPSVGDVTQGHLRT
jgi:isopentenyl diphosphate isomerase/L-lactate dehydrogenase-like FMN-dependent dehydrogenase